MYISSEIKKKKNTTNNYKNKLIEQEKLQMTIPDKPKSRNQKYIIK